MPIGLLKEIAEDCPNKSMLLGIDVGKKTLGLAIGSLGQGLATPLQTVHRTKFSKDILLLADIVKEYEIGGFVLGLPVNMDGQEGPRAQSVRDFAAEMLNYPDIVGADAWIALWDERLSTVSVEDTVDRSVKKRKIKANAKRDGLIDKLAAQLILQGALDYLASSRS